MNTSRTTKRVAGAAIIGAALIGGTAAYAYPPGTSMTASIQAGPRDDGHRGTKLNVLVTNSNPACAISFHANGSQATRAAGHTVDFYQTLLINAERGRHTVTVRTVDCAWPNKESTKSKVQLLKPHIDTKSKVKRNSPFTITVKDFPPSSPFTVVATMSGQQSVSCNGQTQSKGLGKCKLALPAAGNWGLVATGGGVTATTSVTAK